MASQISATSVSKVAVISQVKQMISAFGGGLSGGGAVLIARYYGAGNLDEARKSSANLFFMTIILSLSILLIFIPLSPIILKIAQVPDINKQVILYFILILIELIFVSINNIFIGLEKIKGNSKKILYLNILVLVVKLLANTIFIYGIKVDSIIYLELSTIIGQALLAGYGLHVLFGNKNMLQIKFQNMRPYKKYILPIIKLAIPIFFGKFVMSLGKAAVNAMCGAFYGDITYNLITGSLGISNNLSGLVTTTTSVFEEGESTIVSQNIGNKNIKRTIKVFIRTVIIVMSMSLIGFILVRFIFLDPLTDIFNTKAEIKIIDGKEINMGLLTKEYVKEIFKYDCISIPSLGLTSALLGLLYGYGKTFLSGILNFSRIGIRIVSLLICHQIGLGYNACGISMGISNVLIGVMSLTFAIIFLMRLKKNGYLGMNLSDKEPEKTKLILND
jgi:Na+-driven multidrug efflux pump